MTPVRAVLAVIAVMVAIPADSVGQDRGGAGRGGTGGVRMPPRASAPIELSGYWVSVISQGWRFRMVTPRKGDFGSGGGLGGGGRAMTPEAMAMAKAWDPAADEAAGNACKSYGAAAIMRVPGRLHITWQDDTTLRVDTDAGEQTRLLRFAAAPGPERGAPPVPAVANVAAGDRSWQGQSVAEWEPPTPGRGFLGYFDAPKSRALKVRTTNMRPGYLEKNGVPYSEEAILTEYFDLVPLPGNGQMLVVTSIVDDSRYLRQSMVRTSHFKKQADASGWDPKPCSALW